MNYNILSALSRGRELSIVLTIDKVFKTIFFELIKLFTISKFDQLISYSPIKTKCRETVNQMRFTYIYINTK